MSTPSTVPNQALERPLPRHLALCCDFDGTIAHDGVVPEAMVRALERVAASGRLLVLVTGRELDDLRRVFPHLQVFDRVVAENGALLFTPETSEEQLLCAPPSQPFVDALRRRHVEPLSVGRAIVATWEPHDATVLEVLRELGLELNVVFNKGAVMVLPSGVNKASGLDAALKSLGVSHHNAIGIGDAENDHALLARCQVAVAVANALPALKEAADIVTHGARDAGYTDATEVQQRAIPPALVGRDLMVSSSTGSGKTASFVLPALTRVLAARNDPTQRPVKGQVRGPRVLVLVPTRELAIQVSKAALNYGRHVRGLRVATVVGGVPYGLQLRQLGSALDILIATPGRLMDHMQSGKATLSQVEMLVLDEADRMLDMGFIDDIQFIGQALPRERQTVMYSATFGGHVGRLAQSLLREPQRVDVASHTDTHADIEQRLHWADDLQHKNALLDHLLTDRNVDQALVFTSTQRDADRLADRLFEMGHRVASLHGGMPQRRRNRVLHGLRTRDLRVLVATDVAARGIDVPSISHVINYGLPMKAEDYVHRIGRTGRAGRAGLAVTLAERRDAAMIHHIQRFTTQRIPAAVVAGLEPKRPEPQSQTKPLGQKPFGKPGFGAKNGFGKKAFGKSSFGGDRDRAPFGGPARKPARPRPTGPR